MYANITLLFPDRTPMAEIYEDMAKIGYRLQNDGTGHLIGVKINAGSDERHGNHNIVQFPHHGRQRPTSGPPEIVA